MISQVTSLLSWLWTVETIKAGRVYFAHVLLNLWLCVMLVPGSHVTECRVGFLASLFFCLNTPHSCA